jgi:hypothetical protein
MDHAYLVSSLNVMFADLIMDNATTVTFCMENSILHIVCSAVIMTAIVKSAIIIMYLIVYSVLMDMVLTMVYVNYVL